MSWIKNTSNSGSSTPLYVWVKYADDANGTNMSDSPTGKYYLGLAVNKTTATESNVSSDYTWSQIGSASSGGSGSSTYTWVMYADDEKGTNINSNPLYKNYIGLAFNKTTATATFTPTDYKWFYIAGTQIVTRKDKEVKPLTIKTPEGYWQPYHPKVLYFSSSWNGYKYWMCTTPFPWQRETGEPYENPCIYVSQDGFVWGTPPGLTNPLDTPADAQASYLSDNHLVYRDDTGVLECWYRPTGGTLYGQDGLARRTTTDGINWTPVEILVKQNDMVSSGLSTGTISPAIIWKNNQYVMWFCDGSTSNYQNIWYCTSGDGKAWTNVQKITINGNTDIPWHLDCIYSNSHYYLLVYTKAGRLNLFSSTDGLTFNFIKTVLSVAEARGRDVFKDGLYRSCLVDCGTRDSAPFYRMYYSANDATDVYTGVGVMEGQMLDLKHVNGDMNIHKQTFYQGIEIANSAKIQSEITMADTGEAIGFDYTLKQLYFKQADGTKKYFTFN